MPRTNSHTITPPRKLVTQFTRIILPILYRGSLLERYSDCPKPENGQLIKYRNQCPNYLASLLICTEIRIIVK